MEPLSHEQSYAATHLDKDDRLYWYKKGAHILKGRSKRKRWVAAVKDSDIEKSKRQKKSHKPKKPDDYVDQLLETYYNFAEPYIWNNIKLLHFLIELNAEKYIAHILFISVKSFRNDIYEHIKNYNLNNLPRKYLEQLLMFLISIVQIRDEKIEQELKILWRSKRLPEYDYFPFYELAPNIFSLRDYAISSGIIIQQTVPPDRYSAGTSLR